MSYDLIALLAITLIAILLMRHWERSHPEFDLADLLTGDNGKVSLSKFGQVAALVVSTWGFVVLIQQGKMSEFYFVGYMAAWSATRLANQYINRGSDSGQGKANV